MHNYEREVCLYRKHFPTEQCKTRLEGQVHSFIPQQTATTILYLISDAGPGLDQALDRRSMFLTNGQWFHTGTTLSPPSPLFLCCAATFTVPHVGFQLVVCVCGEGGVSGFLAAQCESSVRSLTHSWAWSSEAEPDGERSTQKRASFPHLLRVSSGPQFLSDPNSFMLWTKNDKVLSHVMTKHQCSFLTLKMCLYVSITSIKVGIA